MRNPAQPESGLATRDVPRDRAPVRVVPVLLLAVVVAVLGVVTFVDLPGNRMYTRVIQDFGHVPAFALVTWCLLGVSRRRTTRAYLLAAGLTVLLGAAVEIVQYFIGGDASLADLWRDTLGAASAASFAWLVSRSDAPITMRNTAIPAGIAAIALVLALLPVAECSRAYRHRNALFPVLADFSSRFDTYLLRPTDPPFRRVSISPAPDGSPRGALIVPYSNATWPGVVFEEPIRNWSVFDYLAVDIYNPGKTAERIVIGIHDATYDGSAADRFTAWYDIGAGTRRILRIPLQQVRDAPQRRKLDLRNIGRLAIAHVRNQPAGPFILYKVWLE